MNTISTEHRVLFDPILQSGERLLWVGAPVPGSKDRRFLLPMVFSAVWTLMLMLMAIPGHIPIGLSMLPNPTGVLFAGVPLLMMGAGVTMIALSWHRLCSPGRFSYAVTDKRLLFHDRQNPESTDSLIVSQISDIRRKGNGPGDVLFGAQQQAQFPMQMMIWAPPSHDRFINIADPAAVERLILDATLK